MSGPENPKTFKQRDAWLKAVLASSLPRAARIVAARIGLSLIVATGECNPSNPKIASGCRMNERTVRRWVDEVIEPAGWLKVKRAIGCRNEYTLLTPDNTPPGVTPDNTPPGVGYETPDNLSADRARIVRGTPGGRVSGHKEANLKRKKESIQSVEDQGQEEDQPLEDPHLDALFQEFWRLHPRHGNRKAARKLFAAAVAAGADPRAIIAGASRYRAERIGEPSRFTTRAENWLAEEGWLDVHKSSETGAW